MSTFNKFEEIDAWKEAVELTKVIYRITGEGKFSKDHGLKDQIQRSAVSIPSNIAEGYERESKKEFIRFLYIAKGSCGELRTQILIAYELGYIEKKFFGLIYDKTKHISALIANLIKYLKTLER